MEQFWNIIHWVAYKFMVKSYIIFVKPVYFLYNTNLSKKFLARNGRTPEIAIKEFKFALMDKRVGQSSFFAYGIMIAIPSTFLCVLHFCYLKLFYNSPLTFGIVVCPMVLYAIISGLLNSFLLLRHDKYVKYFKKFEKQPREWKIKWAWISSGFIAFPYLVLIGIIIISIINVKYSG
jgi:hypothetical protein